MQESSIQKVICHERNDHLASLKIFNEIKCKNNLLKINIITNCHIGQQRNWRYVIKLIYIRH